MSSFYGIWLHISWFSCCSSMSSHFTGMTPYPWYWSHILLYNANYCYQNKGGCSRNATGYRTHPPSHALPIHQRSVCRERGSFWLLMTSHRSDDYKKPATWSPRTDSHKKEVRYKQPVSKTGPWPDQWSNSNSSLPLDTRRLLLRQFNSFYTETLVRETLRSYPKLVSHWRVLPQTLKRRNCWVFGHYPSSCFFLFKTQRFGDWILSPSSGKSLHSWPQSIQPVPISGPIHGIVRINESHY
jgi:hypothetical protein